jgi:hypothetical protein
MIVRHLDSFALVGSDYERVRRRSNGTWMCQRCEVPAVTTYNPLFECGTCDKGYDDCGNDCTIATLSCSSCGASWSRLS